MPPYGKKYGFEISVCAGLVALFLFTLGEGCAGAHKATKTKAKITVTYAGNEGNAGYLK